MKNGVLKGFSIDFNSFLDVLELFRPLKDRKVPRMCDSPFIVKLYETYNSYLAAISSGHLEIHDRFTAFLMPFRGFHCL